MDNRKMNQSDVSIICPHCDHPHDPSGSHEDDYGSWDCEHCGEPFECEINYNPEYFTTKD